MRERFIIKRFKPSSQNIIDLANHIISDYRAQGLRLTLRQLYYQFVSKDWLPNHQKEYKRLGSIITDARLAGALDWDAIEDRGRTSRNVNRGYRSPESFIKAAAASYETRPWQNQENHVEVWIEKEALSSIVERACAEFRVPYIACKGYMSASEMYAAGQRLHWAIEDGKQVKIIHLGDHDPSGLDMTRDITDRLKLFGWRGECTVCGVTYQINFEEAMEQRRREGDEYCTPCYACEDQSELFYYDQIGRPDLANCPIHVDRIALNMDQIEQYKPPPNPAKLTDSRAKGYVHEHGRSSWELDALEPNTLINLIQDAVRQHVDVDQFQEDAAQEAATCEHLHEVAANWADVIKQLGY